MQNQGNCPRAWVFRTEEALFEDGRFERVEPLLFSFSGSWPFEVVTMILVFCSSELAAFVYRHDARRLPMRLIAAPGIRLKLCPVFIGWV